MGQKTNSTIFSLSLKNAEWKSRYIEKNQEESSVLLYRNVEILNYLNKTFKLYGLILHNCKIEYNQTTANFFISFFEKKTETTKLYNRSDEVSDSTTGDLSSFKNNKEMISHIVNNVLAVDLSTFLNNKAITFKIQNLSKKFEFLINNSKTKAFQYRNILKHSKRFLRNPLHKELIKAMFIAVTEKNSAKLIAESISFYFKKQKKRHGFILFLLKTTFQTLVSKFSTIRGVKIIISGRFNGAQRSSQKMIKVKSVSLQSFDSTIDYYEDTAYTPNGTFGIKVWVCEKS